jgi:hypothetical protein
MNLEPVTRASDPLAVRKDLPKRYEASRKRALTPGDFRGCRQEPFLLVGSKRSVPDIHGGRLRIGGPTRLYLPGSRAVLGIHPTIRNGSKRQATNWMRRNSTRQDSRFTTFRKIAKPRIGQRLGY